MPRKTASDEAFAELRTDTGIVRFSSSGGRDELNALLARAYGQRKPKPVPREWKVLGNFQFIDANGKKIIGDLFLPPGKIRVEGKQAEIDFSEIQQFVDKQLEEATALLK